MATVVAVERRGGNIDITLRCPFTSELRIDQSIAHNGVCLTVTAIDGECYTVTAIEETLRRSNLGLLEPGSRVNVERSMRVNGRLDGHIVQGHVDTTARCTGVEQLDGSRRFTFAYDIDPALERKGYVTVEKGSVSVVAPNPRLFDVAIIPYTLENTNFGDIVEGTVVNIEFDIIGKYLARLMQTEQ